MNGRHFEIGTIQAFLDGETTPDISLRLTDHVADCDVCARLLATAEEESAFVFSALERELNTLVPTQRLWSRINESIAVEKKASVWEKFVLSVRASLANPSIAASAGVIMVVGMFAILWMPSGNGPEIVKGPSPNGSEVPTAPHSPAGSSVDTAPAPVTVASKDDNKVDEPTYVKESKMSPQSIQRMMTADYRVAAKAPRVENASDGYIPGEESYVRTIADLKESVDSQKDAVLTPSNRVSYERDMAVVNDSIDRMRQVVKKNPRNQAARQVLYSSYQDKIDLLNSVAQREELIAGMR